MPASAIGQRAPRVEGPEKVTGRALYSANVRLPGMVWGKVLRSPYAFARVTRIDATKARQLPGVLAVITGRDIPNVRVGKRLRDQHILAEDYVRFVGDKVAAVAAEDKDTAEAALDLIEVEYEELEPVLDPRRATEEGASLLHPELRSYAGLQPGLPEELRNVQSYSKFGKGDVEAGFAEADVVVEGSYESAMQHQAYIEPNASTVSIDAEGRVHVWSAQKQPFGLRQALAEALDIPLDAVVYEFSRVGGEFGGKGGLTDVPLCYYLAKATGRPVTIAMTYTEELTAANPRHASYIDFKTGVKRDGTIVAHQARILFDGGAYGAYKPLVDLGGGRKAGGGYRIPNTLFESTIVYTNHVPCGFMRAPGDPQTLFGLESHMDEVALAIGLDPVEFRRKNVLREGDANSLGHTWQDMRAGEVLDAAVKASNYGQPKPRPNVGRGVAMSNRHIGGGESEALIQVRADGSVHILTGTPDAGQGSHTIQQQIVADVLTLPLDRVSVSVAGTDRAPFDGGIGGGKTTHVTGRAAMDAANKAVDELRAWAAEIRGWPEKDVILEDGAFHLATAAEAPVPFETAVAEAIRRKGEPLEYRARYGKMIVEQESFAAQVAEVEVDPETGQVNVLRITTAHDAGTLINPMAAEGQIEGGVMQGLGFATMEELLLEDGKVANANLGEYKIPTIADIPELTEAWVEDAPGPLPFSGRAIAEHSLIVTAAAIANAIRDAVGVRLRSTPFIAEKVYRALHDNHA